MNKTEKNKQDKRIRIFLGLAWAVTLYMIGLFISGYAGLGIYAAKRYLGAEPIYAILGACVWSSMIMALWVVYGIMSQDEKMDKWIAGKK